MRGTGGLLVCDTRSSHRQADEIRADLKELGALPVRWVVNTHAHFDHSFGNARFGPDSDLGAPIYAHERVPAHLDAYERPMLAELIAAGEEPVDEWREIVITPPTVLVGEKMTLDLGGPAAELLHLGRGHTDNDLLLHLPAQRRVARRRPGRGVRAAGVRFRQFPAGLAGHDRPAPGGAARGGRPGARARGGGRRGVPGGAARAACHRGRTRPRTARGRRARRSVRRPRPATAGRSRKGSPARAWPPPQRQTAGYPPQPSAC